jgi:hypothetical protein
MLATAAVKDLAPRYTEKHANASRIQYVGNGGDIEINTKHSNVDGPIIFLAIDACGENIVETQLCATKDTAWAACQELKRKRGSSECTNVNEWVDGKGCTHEKKHLFRSCAVRYDKHHIYVKEFVLDTQEEEFFCIFFACSEAALCISK